MDSHKNCTLKVDINCCQGCQVKSMNKLKKMDGVDSVNYDPEKRMLRVSSNIDPATLIEKFGKWGKKATVYSFEKHDSLQIDKGKCNTCGSSKKNANRFKMNGIEGSFDSHDGDDDREEYNNVPALKNQSDNNRTISWQHPSLMRNSSPKEESPMNKQRAKKSKKLFGRWFSKKEKAAEASSNNNGAKSAGASKCHLPRASMPEYRVWGPFGPPPYGDRRPYYMNQYPPPPMVYPGPMPPWSMPLPQLLLPRMNPMINYASYKDNSLYYP